MAKQYRIKINEGSRWQEWTGHFYVPPYTIELIKLHKMIFFPWWDYPKTRFAIFNNKRKIKDITDCHLSEKKVEEILRKYPRDMLVRKMENEPEEVLKLCTQA